MRILFIVPYVPNLIRVRPFNFIKSLAGRGHRITLATLWESEAEKADLDLVMGYCEELVAEPLSRLRSTTNSLRTLFSQAPIQSAFCWNPVLADRVRSMAGSGNNKKPFDLIHIEHLRGARYGLILKDPSRGPNVDAPVVWDSVDCISHLFRQTAQQTRRLRNQAITKLELDRTERYESWLVNSFDRTLVTSPIDKQALEDLSNSEGAKSEISIVPNGVDLEYFKPARPTMREPATLIMTGKMSYHANITMCLHFINDILPLIWRQRPDVKLWVVGKDPPKEISTLSEDQRITVTGMVPDIRPFLGRATLAVTPTTYGAGIQNKVLEAMASGTPVVASPQAVAALNVTAGAEIMVGANEDDFSRQVLGLLGDKQKREALGRSGRSFVERNHAWVHIASLLEEIYGETINRGN